MASAFGRSFLVALAAAAVASPAVAGDEQTILVSQPPNQIDAVFSDSSDRSFNPFERRADSFALDADASIKSINFWGVYFDDAPYDDTFRLRVYRDAQDVGTPKGEIFSSFLNVTSRTSTGETVANVVKEYAYTADLNGTFDAVAGETYWISIFNNDGGTGAAEFSTWLWETSSAADGRDSVSFDEGQKWFEDDTGDLAFELVEVPAPGSAALLVIGLASVRRRR